jgi:glycosyltransferase involved in cell wall biosynthesis
MISVVIPAYNEEKNIYFCLNALARQQTTQPFEVILVDNNSTDNTIKIAKQFQKKLHLHIIKETQKGRGAARKTGFQTAKGHIILSTDADTIVPQDWIEKLTTQFQDPQVVAVTGTSKIKDCPHATNIIYSLTQPIAMEIYKLFFRHYWLHGFSFAIRKDVYKKAGGFNPTVNEQEDVDLSFKVKEFGEIKKIQNTPVLCSGRRFKEGPLSGTFIYLKSFSNYLLKRETQYLNDIR